MAIDLNLFYDSDSSSIASTDAASKSMIYDIAPMIVLDDETTYVVGWNFGSYKLTSTDALTDVSYSLTEMGLRFGYFFDADSAWSIYLVYNLIATATYNDGTEQEWRGTTYKVEIGYTPRILRKLHGGFKLNYHVASFDEQFVGGSAFTEISNARTLIYPSFHLTYRFK
jgi:hypothetical protein